MFSEVFSETKHRRETFDVILDLSFNCAGYWPVFMSNSAFFLFYWTKNDLQAVK